MHKKGSSALHVTSPSAKHQAKRLLLETSFKTMMRWLFRQSMRQTFIMGEHHHILADAFQKVLDGKIRKLKIHIPPRYSKTEVVKLFCAAGFARNPSSQFIYTSYSDTLALKCSKEIRDMITCDKFQEYWPIEIKKDMKSKKLWETEDDGGMYAVSFGGPITGFGAGKLPGYESETDWHFNGAIIIDDPLKAQDRHRKVAREECIDYFDNTLSSRFNNDDETPCIMIMQRLHPEDLAGYVEVEEGEEWTTINLAAIKEDGTPLWPQKHSLEALAKLAKKNEMFQAQYMQVPIKLGGNLIKPELFKRYSVLPFLKTRYCTADTAQKDKEHNDWTVFQCWGVGHDNKIYLIDQYRKKLKYDQLKVKFKSFWNKHLNALEPAQYGYLSAFYVEDASSGTALIQEAQAEGSIPIVEIKRSQSKLERVLDILLPNMNSGYVHIPLDEPWLHDLETECEEFHPEMSHKHDDQIDAMCDGVEIGKGRVNSVDDEELLNHNLERHQRQLRKLNRRARRR